MKYLIISHIADIDGISPIILMKLCNKEFDYELKEPSDMDEYITNLLEEDLSIYNAIYITDLPVSEDNYRKIENSKYKDKFKVFDHHKTHLYAKDYDYVVIDTNECATTLFYNYLKENYKFKKSVNEYVEHVKNLDIWLWQEKNDLIAKKLGDLFDIYGRDNYIEEIYKRLRKKRHFTLTLFEEKILSLEQDKIDRYINKKEKDMLIIEYEDYTAGLIFCEKYKSEMGNSLSVKHPELDFIVMINLSGGISFRTDKDIDLSVIAKKLNGGGHPKACGATLNEDLKLGFIKNIFKDCKIIDTKVEEGVVDEINK